MAQRSGEVRVRLDGALEPTGRLATVLVDYAAEPMVFEPAQVEFVGGHRLRLEPARGRDVTFFNAAQYGRSDAGDQFVEPVDQVLQALVEPIAPDDAAGFGL